MGRVTCQNGKGKRTLLKQRGPLMKKKRGRFPNEESENNEGSLRGKNPTREKKGVLKGGGERQKTVWQRKRERSPKQGGTGTKKC